MSDLNLQSRRRWLCESGMGLGGLALSSMLAGVVLGAGAALDFQANIHAMRQKPRVLSGSS